MRVTFPLLTHGPFGQPVARGTLIIEILVFGVEGAGIFLRVVAPPRRERSLSGLVSCALSWLSA